MNENFAPEVEDDEEDNPIKGIMIAAVPSVLFWIAVGAGIWSVVK